MKQVNDETELSDTDRRYSGMGSYRQRQEIFRWIAENVGCKKSRTDEYYDPIQETSVQLPCGYMCAWTNDASEYVLSSYDHFKPEAPGAWKQMEKIDHRAVGHSPPASRITGHG